MSERRLTFKEWLEAMTDEQLSEIARRAFERQAEMLSRLRHENAELRHDIERATANHAADLTGLRAPSTRAKAYEDVVCRWRDGAAVAKRLDRCHSAVMHGIVREFKHRHRTAYDELAKLMGRQHWMRPRPYLWMMRLYERYHAIPLGIPGANTEGWSRYGTADLLAELRRHRIYTKRERNSKKADK